MMLAIDHTEMITLLKANVTIADACLLLEGGHKIDYKTVVRALQLIGQAVKSSNSIIAQVCDRDEPKQQQ